MRKPHIITIAGAGSTRVPALVGTLVQYKERFPVSKMIFYDIDGERMGKMEAYDRLVLKCFYPECDVVFTTDGMKPIVIRILFSVRCAWEKQKCALWMRKFLLSMA